MTINQEAKNGWQGVSWNNNCWIRVRVKRGNSYQGVVRKELVLHSRLYLDKEDLK